MRSIFFFLLLAISICCYAQKIDYAHPVANMREYRFQIDLNDQNDTITCLATLHFQTLRESANLLIDLVSSRGAGKGMRVTEVTENGNPLAFTHASDLLRIAVALKKGDDRTLMIRYQGIPADGLIIGRNRYNQRVFFSDNWPNRGHHWLACIDHPSDKAAVEFIVRAPAHYQVVSNGEQIEETDLPGDRRLTRWKETHDLPVKVMSIGVAPFAVGYHGTVNNGGLQTPIYSWVYPQDREKGFYDYSLAKEMLPFFIRYIGPFPYSKLANVQSKTVFGGMENAGCIFYAENSVTGTRELEKLMAHEIAHQWFGNTVTENDWSQVWLSEGFATYLSLAYLEFKYGNDTLQKELLKARKTAVAFSKDRLRPIIDTIETDYIKLLNPNAYQKAGWVLHMLRKQVGDSAFWKGIGLYYSRFGGLNAVTQDFRKIMEEVSGKDLEVFFRQWLYTAGHPVLSMQSRYDAAKKQLLITVIQQQPSLFSFPLGIRIDGQGDDGILFKSTQIKDKQTEIVVPIDHAPASVTLDPTTRLFYEEG